VSLLFPFFLKRADLRWLTRRTANIALGKLCVAKLRVSARDTSTRNYAACFAFDVMISFGIVPLLACACRFGSSNFPPVFQTCTLENRQAPRDYCRLSAKCSDNHSPSLRDSLSDNTFGKVACSLALILGLFSVFRGHEHVAVDRLLAPLMICSFFTYAMVSATSDLSFTSNNASIFISRDLERISMAEMRLPRTRKPLTMSFHDHCLSSSGPSDSSGNADLRYRSSDDRHAL